jgi:hypothetical protein
MRKTMIYRTALLGVVAVQLLVGAFATTHLLTARAAASNPVVGTWEVGDRGQGAWAGGTLLADHSLTGSGSFAFSTPLGEEVASIRGKSWSFTDATQTHVNLCATVVGKQGPVFPIGVPIVDCSITVAVTSGAPTPVTIGGVLQTDTFGKVTLVP